MSNKNGNGHEEYKPKTIYRHLGADVWEKITPDSEQSEVAYSDEIEAELKDDENSENDQDNSQN